MATGRENSSADLFNLRFLARGSPRKDSFADENAFDPPPAAAAAAVGGPSRLPLCSIQEGNTAAESTTPRGKAKAAGTLTTTPEKHAPASSSASGAQTNSKNRFGWCQQRFPSSALNEKEKQSPSASRVLQDTNNTNVDRALEMGTPPRSLKYYSGSDMLSSNGSVATSSTVTRNASSTHNTPRTSKTGKGSYFSDVDPANNTQTPTRNVSRTLRYNSQHAGISFNSIASGLINAKLPGSQHLVVRQIGLLQSVRPQTSNQNCTGIPSFDLVEDPSFWKYHNVQVLIRIRPLNESEASGQGLNRCLRQETSHTLTWSGPPETRFTFDHVAGEHITQEKLFKIAGIPMVENSMLGYNSCMFAYGQTGSGKTHTMLGDIDELDNRPSDNRGLTPRIFEYLFARIRKEEEGRKHENLKFVCKCSFLEIYNEQIADLLEPTSTNLQLREDMKKGVYVENLLEIEVKNVHDVVCLLLQGAANRRVAATNMNRESSRSHSVFTCVIESKWVTDSVTNIRFGRLNLVDLAGSERQKSSGAEGERLKEAANINKSLSTLGLVIMILVDVAHGKQRHVPYRDSKLTFLLQDSLGGNSKTTIIANVSPSFCCAFETLSTLKFAQRAKFIQNNAVVNEDATGDVNALRLQIQQLKDELEKVRDQKSSSVVLRDLSESGESSDFQSINGADESINDALQQFNGSRGSSDKITSKKLKSMEALLAGSLRREQVADKGAKLLAAEIEQLNRLVRQREEDTQCGKMMLRFREDKIRRLEAVTDGLISAESYLVEERNVLMEELQLLRARLDRNPELTRFAMENIRLMEQLRRFQDFYENGEREMLLEEVASLRAQLLEILEQKIVEEQNPPVLTTPQKEAVSVDLASANQENKLLRREVDNYRKEMEESRCNLSSCVTANAKLSMDIEDLETQLKDFKELCEQQQKELIHMNEYKTMCAEQIKDLEFAKVQRDELNKRHNDAVNEISVLRSELQDAKEMLDAAKGIDDHLKCTEASLNATQERAVSAEAAAKLIRLENEELALQRQWSSNGSNGESYDDEMEEEESQMLIDHVHCLENELQRIVEVKVNELNGNDYMCDSGLNIIDKTEMAKQEHVSTDAKPELESLQEEPANNLEFQKQANISDIQTNEELVELRLRFKDLLEENAQLASMIDELKKEKEDQADLLTKEWEGATSKLIEYLAEGDEALDEAANAVEDIAKESSYDSSAGLSSSPCFLAINTSVENFQTKMVHIHKLAQDAESTVRDLSVITLALAKMPSWELKEMQDLPGMEMELVERNSRTESLQREIKREGKLGEAERKASNACSTLDKVLKVFNEMVAEDDNKIQTYSNIPALEKERQNVEEELEICFVESCSFELQSVIYNLAVDAWKDLTINLQNELKGAHLQLKAAGGDVSAASREMALCQEQWESDKELLAAQICQLQSSLKGKSSQLAVVESEKKALEDLIEDEKENLSVLECELADTRKNLDIFGDLLQSCQNIQPEEKDSFVQNFRCQFQQLHFYKKEVEKDLNEAMEIISSADDKNLELLKKMAMAEKELKERELLIMEYSRRDDQQSCMLSFDRERETEGSLTATMEHEILLIVFEQHEQELQSFVKEEVSSLTKLISAADKAKSEAEGKLILEMQRHKEYASLLEEKIESTDLKIKCAEKEQDELLVAVHIERQAQAGENTTLMLEKEIVTSLLEENLLVLQETLRKLYMDKNELEAQRDLLEKEVEEAWLKTSEEEIASVLICGKLSEVQANLRKAEEELWRATKSSRCIEIEWSAERERLSDEIGKLQMLLSLRMKEMESLKFESDELRAKKEMLSKQVDDRVREQEKIVLQLQSEIIELQMKLDGADYKLLEYAAKLRDQSYKEERLHCEKSNLLKEIERLQFQDIERSKETSELQKKVEGLEALIQNGEQALKDSECKLQRSQAELFDSQDSLSAAEIEIAASQEAFNSMHIALLETQQELNPAEGTVLFSGVDMDATGCQLAAIQAQKDVAIASLHVEINELKRIHSETLKKLPLIEKEIEIVVLQFEDSCEKISQLELERETFLLKLGEHEALAVQLGKELSESQRKQEESKARCLNLETILCVKEKEILSKSEQLQDLCMKVQNLEAQNCMQAEDKSNQENTISKLTEELGQSRMKLREMETSQVQIALQIRVKDDLLQLQSEKLNEYSELVSQLDREKHELKDEIAKQVSLVEELQEEEDQRHAEVSKLESNFSIADAELREKKERVKELEADLTALIVEARRKESHVGQLRADLQESHLALSEAQLSYAHSEMEMQERAWMVEKMLNEEVRESLKRVAQLEIESEQLQFENDEHKSLVTQLQTKLQEANVNLDELRLLLSSSEKEILKREESLEKLDGCFRMSCENVHKLEAELAFTKNEIQQKEEELLQIMEVSDEAVRKAEIKLSEHLELLQQKESELECVCTRLDDERSQHQRDLVQHLSNLQEVSVKLEDQNILHQKELADKEFEFERKLEKMKKEVEELVSKQKYDETLYGEELAKEEMKFDLLLCLLEDGNTFQEKQLREQEIKLDQLKLMLENKIAFYQTHLADQQIQFNEMRVMFEEQTEGQQREMHSLFMEFYDKTIGSHIDYYLSLEEQRLKDEESKVNYLQLRLLEQKLDAVKIELQQSQCLVENLKQSQMKELQAKDTEGHELSRELERLLTIMSNSEMVMKGLREELEISKAKAEILQEEVQARDVQIDKLSMQVDGLSNIAGYAEAECRQQKADLAITETKLEIQQGKLQARETLVERLRSQLDELNENLNSGRNWSEIDSQQDTIEVKESTLQKPSRQLQRLCSILTALDKERRELEENLKTCKTTIGIQLDKLHEGDGRLEKFVSKIVELSNILKSSNTGQSEMKPEQDSIEIYISMLRTDLQRSSGNIEEIKEAHLKSIEMLALKDAEVLRLSSQVDEMGSLLTEMREEKRRKQEAIFEWQNALRNQAMKCNNGTDIQTSFASLYSKIEKGLAALSDKAGYGVKVGFSEGCDLVLSEAEEVVDNCRAQADATWEQLEKCLSEKKQLQDELQRKEAFLNGSHSELQSVQEHIAYANGKRGGDLDEFSNKDKWILQLEQENTELKAQLENLNIRCNSMEDELDEKCQAIEGMEGEIYEIRSSMEEKIALSIENIHCDLSLTIKERDNLLAEVLVLNEQLEMAHSLAEEHQAVAAEARQIAETSKTRAEQKEKEVQLLENSVMELESMVNALEMQVGVIKREAERHRLMREDTERELQAFRHQISDLSNVDICEELQRALESKEAELAEVQMALERVKAKSRQKDEQIERCNAYITELTIAAERQAGDQQQKFRALEAMADCAKVEQNKCNLNHSNSCQVGERTTVKSRGSGSPFKCVGSGLIQQMNSEIDDELHGNRQKIEELEAIAVARQKEIFMLNTRLAEAESMTHDVIRDLLGVKLDITNYASLLQNQQVKKIAEKARKQNEEAEEKDKELEQLRIQLTEFIEERESWLDEINRRQAEMVTARVAAEKLRKREQILTADNEQLRAENSGQQKRIKELENEIKKLSGQQNLQQRIHHHAKIKEENNCLRVQNEELGIKLRRTELMFTRVSEELARYRIADGKSPHINMEEEQRLKTKLKETEEEKMEVAQKLLSLCTDIMQAAGVARPAREVDPTVALDALRNLQNRIETAEQELSDIKLKKRIDGEKRRLSELRATHSPSNLR